MASENLVPVTVGNFIRAESDHYFAALAQQGIGRFHHRRAPTPIEAQDVVRMNRDTIYSSAVFDLDAGPVAIALPDPGKRFMSMQVISEDHYTIEVVYSPGRYTYTKERVGTRYVATIVRVLADPRSAHDLKVANALQDAIRVEQERVGEFAVPNWDPATGQVVRDALKVLGTRLEPGFDGFGRREEVDPVAHLIGTAIGWGGNPRADAVYESRHPQRNDGKTAYVLTVKDVPVDGFWSISVYNAQGYFEKNELDIYSINNLTAAVNQDGSYTVRFGGCAPGVANCLPIMPGWNYTVRMYRPREAILSGTWKFPGEDPAL